MTEICERCGGSGRAWDFIFALGESVLDICPDCQGKGRFRVAANHPMRMSIDLAEVKARILYGLTHCLEDRRGRLRSAMERDDQRAVEMNNRYLVAEEAEFVRLTTCNDWDFWHLHRDITPHVLFTDLPAAKPVKVL